MAFLTDMTEHDEVTLQCDHHNCSLSKLTIRLKIARKIGGKKIRLSIDADKDVRIEKMTKRRIRKDDRKG